jgi:hypothetical protein
MNKFWMMGGAVIAVSVTAMVWNAGPVRSSENLLGKAQSEFAMKARDALIQRQMAQASTAPVVAAPPKSEPLLPYVIASLEPVAAPTVVAGQTRFESAAPAPQVAAEPQPVTMPSPDAPIASQEAVSTAATVSAPATDDTPVAKTQMAALPEEPRVSVTPKPIAPAAPVSELAEADTPVVTPTHVAPRRQNKAEREMRHVRKEPRTNAVAYRSERTAPRYITPYNLNSLRARAPELAAAIARYM